MCKCFTKAKTAKIGMVFNIIVFILTIPAIFITGFDYRQTDLMWMDEGPYYYLAIIKVSAVVAVVISFILGMFAFKFIHTKIYQIIFIIFNGLSTLFSMAVAVYVLIASDIRDNNLTQTCHDDYTGMFHNFRHLDKLFQLVDKELCSESCPCDFHNKTTIDEFKYEPQYKSEWKNRYVTNQNQETISSNNNDTVKYYTNAKDCPKIKNVYKSLNDDIFYNRVSKMNDKQWDKFVEYWGRIETKFQCTGWCLRVHDDETKFKFYKYLFSDVNNGVVKYSCMNPFKDWQVKMLKGYGGIMTIVSIVQVAAWVFAINVIATKKEDVFSIQGQTNQ